MNIMEGVILVLTVSFIVLIWIVIVGLILELRKDRKRGR